MSSSQSTAGLLAILSELGPLSASETMPWVAGPFPVAGAASWIDDWHAYRPNPYPHAHEGLDMMAAYGTPVVAVEDGTISQVDVDDSAGLTIWIDDRWGNSFVYMHLSGTANGIAVGQPVRQGDVVGFVGTSGNASSPHLHFEIRPGGGEAIPPKPIVDQWLLIAEARAKYLVRTLVTPEPEPLSPRPVEAAAALAATSRIPPPTDAAASWLSTGGSAGLPAGPTTTVGWLLAALLFVASAVVGIRRISGRRRDALTPITETPAPLPLPELRAPTIPQPSVRVRPERRRVPSKPAVIGVSVSLGVLLVWALRGRRRALT